MIDPLMFFYAVWFALITTVLHILIGHLPDFRLKILVPLVCGSILGFFVIFINPQFAYDLLGIPYYLKNFCFPLIIPLFILTPLLFIEKRAGAGFGNLLVFSGALLAAVVYILISQTGIRPGIGPWQTESLVGIACVIIVSFLVFFSIDHIRNHVPRFFRQGRKSTGQIPAMSPPAPDRKTLVLSVAGLILLCSPMAVIDYYSHSTSSCGGFEIYTQDMSVIMGKTVIHLTDSDFQSFPKMALVIRDGRYTEEVCMRSAESSGACVGKGSFSCSEERQFQHYEGRVFNESSALYQDEIYLEYKGRYYLMVQSFMV